MSGILLRIARGWRLTPRRFLFSRALLINHAPGFHRRLAMRARNGDPDILGGDSHRTTALRAINSRGRFPTVLSHDSYLPHKYELSVSDV